MADTYAGLVADIQSYLVGHLVSADDAKRFILAAEAEINRKLRVRSMLKRSVAAIQLGQYVSLPSDFLEADNVSALGAREYPLRATTMDQADQTRKTLGSSAPLYFVITASTMEIVPAPGPEFSVEMVYFARVPTIVTGSDSATNWLMKRAPDLVLAAALANAASFIRDPQFGAQQRGEVERIISELEIESQGASFGSSPLIARTKRIF